MAFLRVVWGRIMNDELKKSKQRLALSLAFRFVLVILTVVLFFIFFR